jgi:AraC-like DNA-binding protein
VYLAWGERDYHRFPIPVHSNPGWTTWILLDGTAEMATVNGRLRFTAGGGCVAGPECAFGFPQQPSSACRVLVWIWREAPCMLDATDPSGLLEVCFAAEQIQLLEELHAQTRLEVFHPQLHTDQALNHLRGLLDIQIARAAQPDTSSGAEILVHRAGAWMMEHLTGTASMQDLAGYLDVSMMRLHRLFTSETGLSPGAYFHQLKMQVATRLLRHQAYSVKRVAYEIGYRHPNDFSRAFKKHYGVPPSQVKSPDTDRP